MALRDPWRCWIVRRNVAIVFSALALCAPLIGLLLVSPAPAQAANILIVSGTDTYGAHTTSYGTYSQANEAVLTADLTGSGNTVTVVETGVPANLSAYTQIYDTRFSNTPAFNTTEMGYYQTFLNAAPGNTIFLMGENAGCCTPRDTQIVQFISQMGGGTIAVPLSSADSVNPETLSTQLRAPKQY